MNRLLIKLEHVEEAQFARVQAFREHVTVELYTKKEGERLFSCLSHEVLKYKDFPEIEDIYTDGEWSAIGLAALVDIFATDDDDELCVGASVRIQNAPGYTDLIDQGLSHLIGKEGKIIDYCPERGEQHNGCVWHVDVGGYQYFFYGAELIVLHEA